MKAENFFIPAAGARVVDPASGEPLPPEGKAVSGNEVYWLRRLRDGDVIEAKPFTKGKKE